MTRKTKILICGILPPPNFGHSITYQILMNSSFPEKYDATFLDMKFWSYSQHKKINCMKIIKMIKYYFQYIFLIVRKRPEYVFYNISFYKMPFLKDFLFCMTGNLLGCKIVLHDHGQYVKELYESSGNLFKKFIRFFLKRIEASIIMGEETRKVYEGLYPDSKIFVVEGGVEDTKNISLSKDSVKQEEKGVSVLFFSFMSVSKGALIAMECAEKILEKGQNVTFKFAGPVQEEKVQKQLDYLIEKFSQKIEYLGYVEGEAERTKIMRNSDIFLFPTTRDVFGLVLLHAMAEGLPIIASREGNIPLIIQEGKNGFIVPKGDMDGFVDKLRTLIEDKDLRQRMGVVSRERYNQRYTATAYGINMINAFESIAK